ncbi:monocarboxylate transporter 4 [Acetobacter orientalis]|uniref:Monocarboxylate transporter 4 n=1 Tax=Acetobacter orientalis TaxID=146474 RepID=A0A2Z5ZFV7_9PROT|nr:monocarboxylate transporter 4 [Acetobacter orientalis]
MRFFLLSLFYTVKTQRAHTCTNSNLPVLKSKREQPHDTQAL